jgi:hypothetical protein
MSLLLSLLSLLASGGGGGASQKVKETATFMTLALATKELAETFQKNLKANMLTAAQLELRTLQLDINTTILEAICDLTTIPVMNHFPDSENHPTLKDHFETLKQFSTLDPETLFLYYKEVTTPNTYVSTDREVCQEATASTSPASFRNYLASSSKICVDAWSEQLDTIQAKKRALAPLEHYVQLTLTKKASVGMAMILVKEPTIKPAVIKSLIAKGVNEATKDL